MFYKISLLHNIKSFHSFIDDGNGEMNEDGYILCLYKRLDYIKYIHCTGYFSKIVLFLFYDGYTFKKLVQYDMMNVLKME